MEWMNILYLIFCVHFMSCFLTCTSFFGQILALWLYSRISNVQFWRNNLWNEWISCISYFVFHFMSAFSHIPCSLARYLHFDLTLEFPMYNSEGTIYGMNEYFVSHLLCSILCFTNYNILHIRLYLICFHFKS